MRRVVLRCGSASPAVSSPARAFYAPLPDGLILPPPSCLHFTFSHTFSRCHKILFTSPKWPPDRPRGPQSGSLKLPIRDTERVCTERSISLDLSRSLMRDSRLLSDDYRGTRRANVTGDPRLQINNSAVSLRLNQKCVKIKSLKLKGGRAVGRGGGQCPDVLHWLQLSVLVTILNNSETLLIHYSR